MNEIPPKLPITEPQKPARFSRYAKLLASLAVIELVAIAALLVWAIPAKQAKAPSNDQETSNNSTGNVYKLGLTKIASGFESPTAIAAINDTADKRLFVAEQDGIIRVVTTQGKLDQKAFLDIKSKVLSGGEMGLLGLAFHPKLNEQPYLFINYIDKQQHTIIARYTISEQTGRADATSEKILIKLKQPYPNHNGGEVVFGPDGYLYIGLGDGGSGGDPENRAQNKNELFGKVLRIDVDNGDPYAIPATNPFASGGGMPEIWAYGLRNPWRLSFDRQTGDLYIADVGQNALEEINFQAAASTGGENYGWRCFEASKPFNTTGNCKNAVQTAPAIEYDHNEDRCSVTGGHVYRGSKDPAMVGKYFYGDYCSGQIYYGHKVNDSWQQVLVTDTEFSISTFGQDSSGELYVADLSTGTIYRLADKK